MEEVGHEERLMINQISIYYLCLKQKWNKKLYII